MKDVVRKKLGVATSVPIYFSQLRDNKSIDLEDGTFLAEMGYLYPLHRLFP